MTKSEMARFSASLDALGQPAPSRPFKTFNQNNLPHEPLVEAMRGQTEVDRLTERLEAIEARLKTLEEKAQKAS